MYLNEWNKYSGNFLSPVGLCNLVEFEYQAEIRASCSAIDRYLSTHPAIREVSLSVSELMQLIFSKLEDELKHLFLKETGIVFPCIKKRYHTDKNIFEQYLDYKVFETVHNSHQVIIDLTQKIRGLMDNYIIKSGWSRDWKNCVTEMSLLENKILFCIQVEEELLYPKVIGTQRPEAGNDFRYYLN